jgi:hypothetical protein
MSGDNVVHLPQKKINAGARIKQVIRSTNNLAADKFRTGDIVTAPDGRRGLVFEKRDLLGNGETLILFSSAGVKTWYKPNDLKKVTA